MAKSQTMSTPQASSPNTPTGNSFNRSFSISQPSGTAPPSADIPSPTAVLSAIQPSTFDFIPALHQLLSRLYSVPLPPPSTTREHPSHTYTDAPPLEIQGLAPAASVIKVKLQKARVALRALPDMERSVEDQEEEIEALEQNLAKLRTLRRSLREDSG